MAINPMNDDIPGNSHKAREEEAKESAAKKPEPVIFEGDVAGVKRRKTGLFRAWLRRMFLSDRKPSEIALEIIENQIVPGIKDNFRNSMVSGIDAFIYQNSKPSSAGSSNSVSYSKIYNSSASSGTALTVKTQDKKSDSSVDLENGFTNPCFKSKMDATKFLIDMKQYDYPTLSVHTLYMMRKKHIDYTWDAYGWTREEIANVQVVHINNPDYPWMIDLPQAHVIN